MSSTNTLQAADPVLRGAAQPANMDPVLVDAPQPAQPVLLRNEGMWPLQQTCPDGTLARQDIARHALNMAIHDGCHTAIPLDELFHPEDWRHYVVWHNQAARAIDQGVTHATAEAIHGVKDPN